MATQPPITRFVGALERPEGNACFQELRSKFSSTDQGLRLRYEALEKKGKVFLVHSEERPREQGFVVKFNPLGIRDPQTDDVHKEYRILKQIYSKLQGIVPEPIFRSTAAEKRIVGTEFIVLRFIAGTTFKTVGEIMRAGGDVVQMHVAAMKKVAEVHGVVLGDRKLIGEHVNTQTYWQEVVDSCKQKYRKTVGWWRWLLGFDPESYLFSDISKGRKPTSSRLGVVHGSLGIDNFVFNDEMTEVCGILHWKYEKNGDPLMDVSSLLLPFMDIGSYDVEEPVDFVYSATDAEVSKVVMAYRQSLVKGFNDEELEFAKAVCCLRQICAVKRGIYDGFGNNELGGHPAITNNPHTVISLLHRHGEASYRAFRC